MRSFSSARRRLAAGAAILAAVAVPGLLGTQAASAGTSHGLAPEFFTVTISTAHPDGVVNAFGPVHGRNGTDKQVSDTFDKFVFKAGSVNVLHTGTSNLQPKINFKACTATAFGKGSWKFAGGTGKYRHAFGFGKFKIAEFFILARDKHGKCDTNPHHQPKFFKVLVVGKGLATLGHKGR